MEALPNLLYIISIILLIAGLRRLSSPATARSGNLIAASGMGLAILTTLFIPLEGGSNNYYVILSALAVGTIIGLRYSKTVAMTAMPELVSLFNGFGGACAVAISSIELYGYQEAIANGQFPILVNHLVTYLTMLVGGVAFIGSLVAYGKLAGKIKDYAIPLSTQLNITLLLVIVGLIAYQLFNPMGNLLIPAMVLGLAFVYGYTFVQPIGGADMPVVISLLNAFTGVSAALAGIIYGSEVMLVGGILVGSSGTILTVLMCKAMNRSLWNVIIGGFGGSTTGGSAEGEQVVKVATPYDVAVMLRYANKVMFIPGYGMAVAQAQKAVKELDDLLSKNGVEVKYAIHPVAGRMPGHMNVLLAEADVPYPSLLDLDDANHSLTSTDVCIVVGANDVVNPSALTDKSSPIYGMPVLEVLKSQRTIILKRSMNTGYSGIQNPLFFHEKTQMLFGDARKSIEGLTQEVKELD